MKSKWLSSTVVALAGAGWALAQAPAPVREGLSSPRASTSLVAPDPGADARTYFMPAKAEAPVPPPSPAVPPPPPPGHDDLHVPAVGHYDPVAETPYSLNSTLFGNLEYIIWWQKKTG